MQLLAAGAVEYLPTLHSAHELAPSFVPVFVTEPAPHSMHAAAFDVVEYLPAGQATHLLVSVYMPGVQSVQ